MYLFVILSAPGTFLFLRCCISAIIPVVSVGLMGELLF